MDSSAQPSTRSNSLARSRGRHWNSRVASSVLMSLEGPGPEAESADPILLFFEGRGRDRTGRTFEDLLGFDHYELEVDHRYIQWLFPIPEQSTFSAYSPRLSDVAIHAFRARPELRDQLTRAFSHILDFYGLQLSSGPPIRVVEASTFSHRARSWVTGGNHNYIRISRILRSLQCLGLAAQAEAFLAFLDNLALARPDAIDPRTLQYWRLRAAGDGKAPPAP